LAEAGISVRGGLREKWVVYICLGCRQQSPFSLGLAFEKSSSCFSRSELFSEAEMLGSTAPPIL
jgi:hypothetical protein